MRKEIDLPHIACMCAHADLVIVLPLFIIQTQTLPDELCDSASNGQTWFGSSKSGLMPRNLFLMWAILIIHKVSIYKTSLDKFIRNKRFDSL